ncbi:MAG TPA: hypothetical protein DDW50_04510 [Firmicutes bacterium]|jgi:integrase/recombinase XerD|nr:hypothetical protein [Bacillota bacterium]
MLEEFKNAMIQEEMSPNTIESYLLHIEDYRKWLHGSFGSELTKLYRENILDFRAAYRLIEN